MEDTDHLVKASHAIDVLMGIVLLGAIFILLIIWLNRRYIKIALEKKVIPELSRRGATLVKWETLALSDNGDFNARQLGQAQLVTIRGARQSSLIYVFYKIEERILRCTVKIDVIFGFIDKVTFSDNFMQGV